MARDSRTPKRAHKMSWSINNAIETDARPEQWLGPASSALSQGRIGAVHCASAWGVTAARQQTEVFRLSLPNPGGGNTVGESQKGPSTQR
jgi:hypothetical protein